MKKHFSTLYKFFILSLLCLFFPIHSAQATASVNIATSDSSYRDIDKLIAHRLIKTAIMGQRPYSRLEMARLTLEAQNNFLTKQSNHPKHQKTNQAIEALLKKLTNEFSEEIDQLQNKQKSQFSFHPLESITTQSTATDSPFRKVPNDGTGGINAVINPLLESQQGSKLVKGSSTYLETTSWMRATDFTVLNITPRAQLNIGDNNVKPKGYIENLYAKLSLKNFELEVGRDHVLWGQGDQSTLLFSTNPRAFDLIKITNDHPFYFPWIFKHLGAQKISFMYANMGPEQNFPYSYIASWKWSLLPCPFFETGFSLGTQSGGKNSPEGSFGNRLSDIFPFSHVFTGHQAPIGNKIIGGDFNLKIPPLRNSSLYSEYFFDDIKGDKRAQFIDVAAYIFGFYIPRLTDSGSVDLRLEYHQVGEVMYRHGQYTSGWTLNQFVLGDPLGPDSKGFYITSNWDFMKNNRLESVFAIEDRSGDSYLGLYPDNAPDSYKKTKNLPEEMRYRFTTLWSHQFKNHEGITLNLKGGYERANNYTFISGSSLNNFFGQVLVSIKPHLKYP